MTDREDGASPEVSTGQLALVLAVFFILGSAMTQFIWATLSDFLAGRSMEGGIFLLALAMLGVFAGFAWLLARYLQNRIPWQ
jgi:hypothetical protein